MLQLLLLAKHLINLFNNGSPDPGIYKIKYIIIPPFPKGVQWRFSNTDWRCKFYHKDLVRIPDHPAWDQFKVPKNIKPKKTGTDG